MRLGSIKISNVLSYPHLENFDEAPNTIDLKEDLNILIGSNGSGKSNFVEVINKLFQGHFFENYFINDNGIYNDLNDKVIRINSERKNSIQYTLHKHYNYRTKPSIIELELIPDSGDITNMHFLLEHFEELKKYSIKYCDNQTFFNQNPEELNKEELSRPAKFRFNVDKSTNSNSVTFSHINTDKTKEYNFFYHYLLLFNQLQTLLEFLAIYQGTSWPLLKNPFAFISSMRTYGGFNTSLSVGTGLNAQVKQANQQDANHSAKNYTATDLIFRVTGIKIAQLFRDLTFKEGVETALKKISSTGNVLYRINTLLNEHLGFKLNLENHNQGSDTIMLQIYKDSELVEFSELSMGQKSIFYLLFAVYGYDIQNGLLIIDEPELHLHISMQKKYFNILKEICKEANVQIIIATHSSIFIDEYTIKNTFRFFKDQTDTRIICPQQINQSQKDLIKILTYTNSSRIFFSDNVLLVEGDSDAYFFNFFYENYIRKYVSSEKNLEIVYIEGKGNFQKWRDFLMLFNIQSFFIGDFDNVKDFGILSKLGINYTQYENDIKAQLISKLVNEKIQAKPTKDGKELLRVIDDIIAKDFQIDIEEKNSLTNLWIYLIEKQGLKRNQIITYIQKKTPGIHQQLNIEIEKLYSIGVYLLKEGDLENYLGISKGLDHVIQFCQTNFNDWVQTEKNKSAGGKIAELESFFRLIQK